MKLEFKINEQDFLDFQLFTASKSEKINWKKKNGWISYTAGSIALACYFYLNENNAMMVYFGLVGIVSGIFYPTYFRWRYKKHYQAHIREHYSKRFGQVETLEINNDWMITADNVSEGKIKLSEIERIDETNNHFFLKISSGHSLLIPKRELENIETVREKFKDIGFHVNDERKWAWK